MIVVFLAMQLDLNYIVIKEILNAICAYHMAQKMNLYLVNMKCQVMKKGGLYGIIRLDTLARVSAPVVNTGQTLNQKIIIGGKEQRNSAKLENINSCVFRKNVSFDLVVYYLIIRNAIYYHVNQHVVVN